MSKIGAAKVMTETGPVWCHFSEDDETLKLRRYLEGTIYEVENKGIEIEEFVPLNVCKTLVESQVGYGYLKSDVWKKILKTLESTVPPPVKAAARSKPKSASKSPVIVPITHLRQFYETMKLLETATWVNLAEFYSKSPDSLERLWNHSRKAFLSYKNADNWGRGETEELPAAPESVLAIRNTDEFTAFITIVDNSCSKTTGYAFVERELNPRRTRLGVFSDKRPATKSGTGGLDVLLQSNVTGFPAVGEVKVNNDKNAFFALIQAMTYAVELSTPSQLARLKNHFAAFERLDVNKAKIEIALLMVNHAPDATRIPVLKLIKALNDRKKCEGLGKVVLVENQGEEWNSHS